MEKLDEAWERFWVGSRLGLVSMCLFFRWSMRFGFSFVFVFRRYYGFVYIWFLAFLVFMYSIIRWEVGWGVERLFWNSSFLFLNIFLGGISIFWFFLFLGLVMIFYRFISEY